MINYQTIPIKNLERKVFLVLRTPKKMNKKLLNSKANLQVQVYRIIGIS